MGHSIYAMKTGQIGKAMFPPVLRYSSYFTFETVRVRYYAFLNTKTGSNLYGDPARVPGIALRASRNVSMCQNPFDHGVHGV